MCPNCGSNFTKKIGKRNGIQRYKCSECLKKFQSTRRPSNLTKIIFQKYLFKRQSYSDLAEEYSRSISWVKKQISCYEVSQKKHHPRAINLVCDTTFYGRRSDKLGTVIFHDSIKGEALLWKHVESERCKDYKILLKQLLFLGYTINSVTIDGKRGLYTVFCAYPIQMCHFHQKKTIRRYITKHPKLEASKDLQKLLYRLTQTNEKNFKQNLYNWHLKHENFLNEKTVNLETGEVTYTHSRLRKAYASLCSNIDHLFTYKKHKHLNIPNTTNHLDGGVFSPLKILIKVHRGLSKKLKLKIVDEYFMKLKKKT